MGLSSYPRGTPPPEEYEVAVECSGSGDEPCGYVGLAKVRSELGFTGYVDEHEDGCPVCGAALREVTR